MERSFNLEFIQEIDRLWEPIYPYLARHIADLYGRKEGDIVEIGPFSGVIAFLSKAGIGDSFTVATFPAGMGDFFRRELEEKNLAKKIEVIETDPWLVGLKDGQFDLAIFRGALFFPDLFRVDWSSIYRILKKGGMALLGGGFGKFTPEASIQKIKKRSRELNLTLGKTEIDQNQLMEELRKEEMKGRVELISEGGLWLRVRKEDPC